MVLSILQTTIQQWRAKIRQLNRETEERNRLLLEEKLSIQKHYQQLKQRIQVYRGTQNQRLLQLSQSANQCKLMLTEKLELAKRVLQLSEQTRKLETVQEQVLPFAPPEVEGVRDETIYGSSRQGRGPEDEEDLDDEEPGVPGKQRSKASSLLPPPPAHQSSVWSTTSESRAIPPPDRLANFYRKYNVALMDNIAIDKERERLSIENGQLEDLIQQFISGTKLSDVILADDNPLFVVNGRANLNHVPPVRKMQPVVQEATTITAITARQHGR